MGAESPRKAYRVRLSGREPITHPLAPLVIDLALRLARRGLVPPGAGAIALRAGHTMLTTAQEADLAHLGTDDLVEVADYDPVERLLIAVGPREPNDAAPLLSLVMRHRVEVGAAILVPAPADGEAVSALPQAEPPASTDPLDIAKPCLRALRDDAVIHCPGVGILATAGAVPAAERGLMAALALADPARFGGDAWAGPAEETPTKKRNGHRRST